MENTTSKQGDFLITCQHKLPKEERSDGSGGTKEVHVVIKQSSFIVVIVSETHVLEGCTVDCTLVYDNVGLTEVHYINQKPISYTVQITSANTITCDIRILVLSSQHEDMLFKVLFKITSKTGEVLGNLFSFPLRVISKADGKKKNLTKPPRLPPTHRPEQKAKPLTQPPIPSVPLQPTQIQNPPPVPLPINQHNTHQQPQQTQEGSAEQEENDDSILNTLQYQQQLLRELTQQTNSNPLSMPLVGMITSYQQLPQNQRIPQLLRIISSLNAQETALMSELVSMIVSINTTIQNDPQQNMVQPFQQFPQPNAAYQTEQQVGNNQFNQMGVMGQTSGNVTVTNMQNVNNVTTQQVGQNSQGGQPTQNQNNSVGSQYPSSSTPQPTFQTNTTPYSPQVNFSGGVDGSFYQDSNNN
ncbi:hypothetical protein EIN_114790 [Entamoeba invadens IP1]|uniref:Transcriptional regulator cudA n=1 Tax=Entamoeba invadens IP1 TaxID=370355 RepID=A0A0A1TXY3_ENTIV|nr:hypothetical protein EIN_114790 [Entamoeba invadens IP1]ELP86285.1 hypothetical protein EIN_114790 [Entamoeba invadens IP1]|eukprot:XP_004185631.1 hypothetical protein EIN_114790 [Entamoeba invadens IP1]